MLLTTLALAASTWIPVTSTSPTLVAPEPGVEWLSGSLTQALSRASLEKKFVFAYFWTNSSQQCQRTWTDAISSAAGQTALAEYICFSAPVGSADTAELVQKYNIRTLPTMLVLNTDGEPEDALLGYHSEGLLVLDLNRIRGGTDTVSDRRKLAEAAPDDLNLRFSLAAKLDHVGANEESKALYDSIMRDDPRGESVVSARLQLWKVLNEITDSASDPGNPVSFELKPIYKHMRRVKPDEIIVEGWDWIADIEGARGEKANVLKAMRSAWPHMSSDNQTMSWGLRTASYHWTNRDDLSPSDKAFALKVAQRCAELAIEQEQDDYEGDMEERDREALDVLAVCYFMNGRIEDALRTIEASIDKHGTTPEREQTLEMCRAGKP